MSEYMDLDPTPYASWPPDAAGWVLVVDDDAFIRDVVCAALQADGYRVLEAANGEHALRLLRESEYPLVVLMDVRMPGLTGLDVLRAVVSDARLAERHSFVLMTADLHTPQSTALPPLDRLQVPVMRKPFDLDDLLATVAQARKRLPHS